MNWRVANCRWNNNWCEIKMMALTQRMIFDFHQGLEKVRLVLVGRVYDSRAHRHKVIDYGGVGRVQIAGDDVGQFEVVERIVLLGEPVPLVRATVDGQPKQSWNTSDRRAVRRQCATEARGRYYGWAHGVNSHSFHSRRTNVGGFSMLVLSTTTAVRSKHMSSKAGRQSRETRSANAAFIRRNRVKTENE